MLDRQKYRQTAVTSNAKYYFETTVLTVKHVDLKSLLTIHSKPYLTRSRVHNYKPPPKPLALSNVILCIAYWTKIVSAFTVITVISNF